MGLSAADAKTNGDAGQAQDWAKKTIAKRKTGPLKALKVAPKYQVKADKYTHKWTGRGCMPLAFKEFVEEGGSLDKCLIKK